MEPTSQFESPITPRSGRFDHVLMKLTSGFLGLVLAAFAAFFVDSLLHLGGVDMGAWGRGLVVLVVVVPATLAFWRSLINLQVRLSAPLEPGDDVGVSSGEPESSWLRISAPFLVMFGLLGVTTALQSQISDRYERAATELVGSVNLEAAAGNYGEILDVLCDGSSIDKSDIAAVLDGFSGLEQVKIFAFTNSAYLHYESGERVRFQSIPADSSAEPTEVVAERSHFTFIVSGDEDSQCLTWLRRRSFSDGFTFDRREAGEYPASWDDQPGYAIAMNRDD